jgi:hypothetical protein
VPSANDCHVVEDICFGSRSPSRTDEAQQHERTHEVVSTEHCWRCAVGTWDGVGVGEKREDLPHRAPIILGSKEHLTKRLQQHITVNTTSVLLLTCVKMHKTT